MIGPSNPVISIGPILAVPGMREALARARRPSSRSARSSGGEVLKGPTVAFMRWAGQPARPRRDRRVLRGLIDGLVGDERTDAVPVLETDVMMAGADGRRRLAEETLRSRHELGREAATG